MFNQSFWQTATSPIGLLVLLVLLLVVGQVFVLGITYLWKIRKYSYKEANDLLARQNNALTIIVVLIIVDVAYIFLRKRIVEGHVADGNALLIAMIFVNSVFLFFSLWQIVARYLARVRIRQLDKLVGTNKHIIKKIQ